MINVAEILKDCPKGMELDCVLFNNPVTLDEVVDIDKLPYPITVTTVDGGIETFTKYGQPLNLDDAKCVIFPKGKNTWREFIPPCKFKDGDIISDCCSDSICIFKGEGNIEGTVDFYCGIYNDELYIKDVKDRDEHFGEIDWYKFADEEEKQKLFNAIKSNGYRWDAETKTLEKLVPNKFDITTLKPFDKVLARCSTFEKWRIQLFEKYDKTCKFPFICMGYNKYKQCIPYEGNEHLLDKADDCIEYYKNW